jgi:hypothetical protein
MRLTAICFSVVVALAAAGAGQSLSSPQDPNQEDVRGAFLTTRPKTSEKTKTIPSTRRPRRRPTAAPTSTAARPSTTTAASTADVGPTSTVPPISKTPARAPRIGLGLTLFMRDSNGLAVRTDPSHEFHKGDRVRVLLETNADGHLYIFNTTDGGDPVMIYPDVQLDEGGNYIQAHVPFEIPSSVATEERLRWLRFDEHAGTERLYFVFTREPLPAVPIEDDLVKYCGDKKTTCAWHPTAELWTRLQKELNTPLQVAKAQNYGAAQSSTEQTAATRGLGLAADDPEPSLVMMTASSASGILVAALELAHK